jgi:putative transposase
MIWPITTQCRVLQVTCAAYYKSIAKTISKTEVKKVQVVSEVQRIAALPRHDDYGSPRMHRELKKANIHCCENTVAKYMREAGIQARTKPKFRINTTDSNHDLPIAPNLLNQCFTTETINQVWLTDFTYIHTREGFTYLCAIKDMYSRKIVGWATSKHIDSQLAIAALNQAHALRRPQGGLIVHSDRGSQFASKAYRDQLAKHEIKQSMSRKGNCYDNAPMESFFKSFKTEEVNRQTYETHEQATRAVIDYIERFYNPIRIHTSVGFVSPNEFEKTHRASSKELAI